MAVEALKTELCQLECKSPLSHKAGKRDEIKLCHADCLCRNALAAEAGRHALPLLT